MRQGVCACAAGSSRLSFALRVGEFGDCRAVQAIPRRPVWTMRSRLRRLSQVERTPQNQRAGTLSGGEQQMLAVGRALISNPRLILLDEPTEGLSPLLVRELQGVLKRLKEEGTTLLLVEQRVNFALALTDRVYLMGKGQIAHGNDAGSACARTPPFVIDILVSDCLGCDYASAQWPTNRLRPMVVPRCACRLPECKDRVCRRAPRRRRSLCGMPT